MRYRHSSLSLFIAITVLLCSCGGDGEPTGTAGPPAENQELVDLLSQTGALGSLTEFAAIVIAELGGLGTMPVNTSAVGRADVMRPDGAATAAAVDYAAFGIDMDLDVTVNFEGFGEIRVQEIVTGAVGIEGFNTTSGTADEVLIVEVVVPAGESAIGLTVPLPDDDSEFPIAFGLVAIAEPGAPDGLAAYSPTAGYVQFTSAQFDPSFRNCSSQLPSGATCEFALGTIGGSFEFTAEEFFDSGNTISRSADFSNGLPAVKAVIRGRF